MVADNREGLDGRVVEMPTIPRLDSKRPKREVKREPIFTIDEVEYTAPAEVPPHMGLKYLHLMRTEGQGAANYFMLMTVLGEEGYLALMNYEQLEQEEYDLVLKIATKKMIGPQEVPKGPSGSNGSTK